ncbi:MAG: hypothetical protein Q9227_008142 [Pyrenula ochraceoflavens]
MGDEKHPYENLPIPTYEEATSSRPHSSQSLLGPEEISDDAERQGLLQYIVQHDQSRPRGYHPPTVESARSSLDLLPSPSLRGSEDATREEMEQMEVEDPLAAEDSATHPLIGNRISKHFSTFTQSLSSLHLPFRQYLPRFKLPSFRLGRFARDDAQSTARFMIFGRLFGIFIIVSVIYVLIASGVLQMGKRGGAVYADPELLRVFVQNHMNEHNHIQEYLEFLTEYPHISGLERNYVLAEWMEEQFKTAGLVDVSLERFDVYLNYPKAGGRKVAILDPPEKRWEAVIEEELAYTDPIRQQPYVFHGYSKSGDVSGRLIYANYGSRADFQLLEEKGVSVNGSVVLVRYGGTQTDRGLKVKAAELAGAVGCIIYSDPAEDGFAQGPVWPDGRFRSDDSAERGTVVITSYVAGDPLTPGWASTPGEKHRASAEESPALVNIPSIPLAWRDAQQLLKSIEGSGNMVEDDWKGKIPDVEYWTGDGSSPLVRLLNDQYEDTYKPIHNILGRIPGWEQPNKKIIVGNHRDAWCFGAADPSSGTAIMLEVMRIFGDLMKLGWRPLRSIEFASWDAEEYNLVGSTEHVENRMDDLRLNGVAYVNVDVGVVGTNFSAYGSPVFERLLHQVMKRTSDPNVNQTLFEVWQSQGKQLGGLGAGSDYVAFQDFAGTSSLDITFEGQPFPYHSCYDNFEWMQNFGDPGFAYHKVLGEVIALLILELSNKPILPFDMEDYARWVHSWIDDLSQRVYVDGPMKYGSEDETNEVANEIDETESLIDLKPLWDAADVFSEEARQFHRWDQDWAAMYYGSGEFESNVLAIKRMSHNNRLANFETHLLDLSEGGGLPNRTQYKHVLYAPEIWSGYEGAHFPGVTDAIDAGNWTAANEQVEKVAAILSKAARKLNHN